MPVSPIARDRDRMLEALDRGSRAAGSRSTVATSLATQALIPGTTGRHQMKSVPHVSSQDGPGRVQLEGFGPTRNRKVVGSNPTSGSKSAGQSMYALLSSPALLASLIILVREPGLREAAPLRYVGVRPINRPPLEGPPSSAHSGRISGGRTIQPGPAGRGASQDQFAAAPPYRSHGIWRCRKNGSNWLAPFYGLAELNGPGEQRAGPGQPA